MKRILAIALIALASLATIATDAEAKRLGGGTSIGKQSQSVARPAAPSGTQQAAPQPAAPAAAPAPAPAAQPMPAPKPPSPWKGILGGALAGIGLGMLFSHLGMGAGMANAMGSILMIAIVIGLVMLAMRMFRRREEPAYAGAAPTAYAYEEPPVRTPEIGSRIEQPLNVAPAAPAAPAAAALPFGIPEGFDSAGFLRNAKTYFIRLQAAWDRADLNDIREFTSPEMFAEIRMQVTERGASNNNTDVVSLDAEMLGIETHPDYYLASVKFSGRISEAQGAPAEPFTEIWNLSKPINGGGWVLAGIQQLS